ncbi:GNAT family N-acetyltransferase [Litorisediminicola beolgyonensis]|uniref:GNAT family N-acetyltransferase n=1 Tax=Litorisediminicola beolgyonensis TaxID=1173614 RepID=A0ABW3ZN06_9RHOB
MQIRPYTAQDASALAAIFHEAVHGPASQAYSAAQRRAWSPAPASAEQFASRISEERQVWVATDAEDRPLGFIELEADGHIDRFYCRPDVAGTGVGAALYRTLEEAAVERGIRQLRVEASEAARRFFEKQGFVTDARREFPYNGVEIHNYAMHKDLSRAASERS